MKKKFKILACALLLVVPCMFIFTGCKKVDTCTNISDYEYSKLVLESGTEYFENYKDYEKFGNMTISSNYSYIDEETESLTYKENTTDEEYTTEDFTISHDTHVEQSISIYNVGEGESAEIYMQFTCVVTNTQKGYRVNETDETLENYEEKNLNTTIQTLIKDGDVYKYFISETNKEDENEETTEKSYYVYSTRDEYIQVVDEMLYSINEEIMLTTFYPSRDLQYMLFVDRNSYQDGNEFGSTMEYALTSFGYDYFAGLMYQKMEVNFKDNLPSHIKANVEIDYVTSYMNSSSEINISFSANEINKPNDITVYELTDSTPYIYFAGAIIMPGE